MNAPLSFRIERDQTNLRQRPEASEPRASNRPGPAPRLVQVFAWRSSNPSASPPRSGSVRLVLYARLCLQRALTLIRPPVRLRTETAEQVRARESPPLYPCASRPRMARDTPAFHKAPPPDSKCLSVRRRVEPVLAQATCNLPSP